MVITGAAVLTIGVELSSLLAAGFVATSITLVAAVK